MFRAFCRRVTLALTLFTMTLSLAVAQVGGENWNPVPRSDDVVVPLPCAQAMVLRRVTTQETRGATISLLDDRRILLGRPSVETAYYDYSRQDFIAGHFFDENGRFFLIGKYEVTRSQYLSLMGEGCQMTADDDFMPAAQLSWYDAVEFTRRLTAHVRQVAAEVLNSIAGHGAAYFRLPTEAEWEFAARGGLSVSMADFQADWHPMNGNHAGSIWYNDPLSAQGATEPIGILSPNPLNIYDIYGNVAEMLLEPFRLNRAGRMHGQAGGFIAKGGSFLSRLTDTGSAARREHGYFRDGTNEEFKAADVGFRVVAASPALVNRAGATAIQEEWRRAGQARLVDDEDPVVQLSELQNDLSDLQLSRDIDTIKQSIMALSSGRNEAQFRLLDGLLLSSGRLVLEMRKRHQSIVGRNDLLGVRLIGQVDRDQLTRANSDDEKSIIDLNFFNHDLIVRMASEFSADEISDRAGQVVGELRQRGFSETDDIVRAVANSGTVARLVASREVSFDREAIRRLTLEDRE